LFDASSAIRSIYRAITPHHRQGRKISLMCGAPANNAGVDLVLRPLWVRARLQTAGKRRPLRLFLSQRRPACACVCAWLSVLYHSREKDYGMCYPASHRADLCFASRGTTCFHTVHVCKPPYASMECTVCCMQYAACSCPASTTSSATGSNSRVLTHRLTVCSRSELLHRGKYYAQAYQRREFECRHASSRS
jgi:hypothetical protein